jgi:hypothetical protein
MGTFDPTTFMDATFNGANDTKVVPPPIGDWPAIIEEPKMVEWKSRDGSKSGWKLSMNLKLDSPEVAAATQRDTNRVRHDVMLDLTDSGNLDMGKGKNISLGRLREATGLNKPGEPFSFRMFEGKMIKARIGHRVDGEDVYAEVKAVTAQS